MNRPIALVTGANGFIGSHLCERLLQQGYHVRALVRTTSNLQFIENLDVELVYGELIKPESLSPILENVDYVYHPGGLVRARNEKAFMQVNRIGTRNLLQAVENIRPNLKRFVHISSQAAAGPSDSVKPITEDYPPAPVSAYGRSKLASEVEVMSFKDKFPITIIRPSVVYGPRDSDVYKFFRLARRGINLRLGMARMYVSLINVTDLVACILAAAQSEKAVGEVFFVANPESYEYTSIMHMIADIMDRNIIDLVVPVWVAKCFAGIIEYVSQVLRKSAPLNKDKLAELSRNFWLCSPEKAKNILGWNPVIPVEEGFRQTWQWYLEKKWL